MEHYDAAKAARVWQRVQNGQTGPEPLTGLPALIGEELLSAAAYQQLSRKTGARDASALHRLWEENHAHAACLKGIHNLVTGEKTSPKIPSIPLESPELMLRRCYGREMRCLAQYEVRSSDPEYGAVFAGLAGQKRVQCMTLLELIGKR